MAFRYFFGPVSTEFADQWLHAPVQRGECLAFDETGAFSIRWHDTWQAVAKRFPAGWQPDFLVLCLQHRIIPQHLWNAPIPIIGLASGWDHLWHLYRRLLRRCDLVFTDALGVSGSAFSASMSDAKNRSAAPLEKKSRWTRQLRKKR